MESNARALNYYNHGTAAPTISAMLEAEAKRMSAPPVYAPPVPKRAPKVRERPRRLERTEAVPAKKTAPKVSIFAIFSTLFVSVLMVFVVLAQINFNETATETVRLNAHLTELNQQHRALELSFERAVDLRTIEHYAINVLGMTRPDASPVVEISRTPRDTAMVVQVEEDHGLQGFGQFIVSLTEYFR